MKIVRINVILGHIIIIIIINITTHFWYNEALATENARQFCRAWRLIGGFGTSRLERSKPTKF